jgi:hypothetical protein
MDVEPVQVLFVKIFRGKAYLRVGSARRRELEVDSADPFVDRADDPEGGGRRVGERVGHRAGVCFPGCWIGERIHTIAGGSNAGETHIADGSPRAAPRNQNEEGCHHGEPGDPAGKGRAAHSRRSGRPRFNDFDTRHFDLLEQSFTKLARLLARGAVSPNHRITIIHGLCIRLPSEAAEAPPTTRGAHLPCSPARPRMGRAGDGVCCGTLPDESARAACL